MRTLIFGVVFQAGSAGFVVSLAMQCSQDLTPFAGKTLHEILVVYHLPENCGNFGEKFKISKWKMCLPFVILPRHLGIMIRSNSS